MNMLKTVLLLCVLSLIVTISAEAQSKITGFEALLTEKNGTQYIEVTPNTFDGNSREPTDKMWKVHGLLVCFKYNGVQKAERLDITYDVRKEGKYSLYLGTASKVSDIRWQTFDMLMDEAYWPEKKACFK